MGMAQFLGSCTGVNVLHSCFCSSRLPGPTLKSTGVVDASRRHKQSPHHFSSPAVLHRAQQPRHIRSARKGVATRGVPVVLPIREPNSI